jgi:cytochrome c oxidase cbb3-type subunit III
MKQYKSHIQKIVLLLFLLFHCGMTFAGGTTETGDTPGTYNWPVIMAVTVISILALVIMALGITVISARGIYQERLQREKEKKAVLTRPLMMLLALLIAGSTARAEENTTTTETASAPLIAGLSDSTVYFIFSIILLEVIVIFVLLNILKFLVGIRAAEKAVAIQKESGASALTRWWNKLNKSVAIEKEKDIDLSHDYDGIRELDNAVPPWWSWTFVACIIFSIVYLWRFHVSGTAPLQVAELKIAMQKAEDERQAYLLSAAAKVDENTVTMLDAGGIAAGRDLFAANCTACHGKNGEGNTVGPNLTDDYWIHKGSINDIFKTIKYGWIEKGMKSWKDDFSPAQIAQLSSYVKSLKGSNPPNAKAPEGERYEENTIAAKDSTGVKTDTTTAK